MLTLSVLSPGASVLVAGADILNQAGTGAALAFLLGGALTLVFTFAQAELGSSFPLAGGDYATIASPGSAPSMKTGPTTGLIRPKSSVATSATVLVGRSWPSDESALDGQRRPRRHRQHRRQRVVQPRWCW